MDCLCAARFAAGCHLPWPGLGADPHRAAIAHQAFPRAASRCGRALSAGMAIVAWQTRTPWPSRVFGARPFTFSIGLPSHGWSRERMWPADRARTPREYLRLLPAADPRLENLTTLTRSFERTWYGGREAGSSRLQGSGKAGCGTGGGMKLFASLDARDRKLLFDLPCGGGGARGGHGPVLRATRIATTIRCPAAI